LTCRIRDDSHLGRGITVQIFDDDWLMFAQRCPLDGSARSLTASLKRDFLRHGWTSGSGAARREV
jgi:hypothetical protein